MWDCNPWQSVVLQVTAGVKVRYDAELQIEMCKNGIYYLITYMKI
jgi:hypothetical protein